MPYDTIMGMLFYEFQNVLETYSQILEERREEEEKENEENGLGINRSKYSPESMLKNVQNYMPKIPQMPNLEIPKF